jgi:hypothetical protein
VRHVVCDMLLSITKVCAQVVRWAVFAAVLAITPPQQGYAVFDLYHSIDRTPRRYDGVVPCILPSSQMFLIKGVAEEGRLLTPLERLALMGWDLDSLTGLLLPVGASSEPSGSRGGPRSVRGGACWSWGELGTLAGNAFSGFAFSGVACSIVNLLGAVARQPAP